MLENQVLTCIDRESSHRCVKNPDKPHCSASGINVERVSCEHEAVRRC